MRKRWSAAGKTAPNSLMIAASSAASSFSVRQNGDSTARAASGCPSARCARASDRHALRSSAARCPPKAVDHGLRIGVFAIERPLAVAAQRLGARPLRAASARPRRSRRSTRRPGRSWRSPRSRMCRSSASSSGRLSRYSRAPATSPAASASSPAFSMAMSRLSEGAIVDLGVGAQRDGRGQRLRVNAPCRALPSAARQASGASETSPSARAGASASQGRRSSGSAACPWA